MEQVEDEYMQELRTWELPRKSLMGSRGRYEQLRLGQESGWAGSVGFVLHLVLGE